ncbi:MAG: hypothetical protein A2097_04340 [Desulfobacula sp. GWF2_41_7]|nr:MAG: hypothetical protein A2097_04340 [Desulfobacula sp. GWF2_41_7]
MIRIIKQVIFLVFLITQGSLAWPATQGTRPIQEIRIGYVPILSQLPLVVSYEDLGISNRSVKIIMTRFGSFNGLEAAMRVQAIDFASLPVITVLKMKINGIDVKIVGQCSAGGSRLVTRNKGGLKDIRGLLIGVPDLESNENLLLSLVFSPMDMRLGIEYKTIGISLGTVIEDYTNNRIDSMFMPEPFGTIIENRKIGFMAEGQKDVLTGKFLTVLTINSSFLNKNKNIVSACLESIVKACGFIEKDIKDLKAKQVSILQKKYFDYDEDIIASSLENRKGEISFTKFLPEKKEINRFSEEAVKMKILTHSVNLDDLLSLEIMKQAMEKK